MFKVILLFIFLMVSSGASTLHVKSWEKGDSFLNYLEKNNLPLGIYYDLDRTEQELAAEIVSGVKYQTLKSDDGQIEQVMIPIGEELQLHIIKNGEKYELTTTPIIYQEEKLSVTIDIQNSPYQDLISETNNYLLAHEFIHAFRNSVNFKRLRKGDRVVVFYRKRTRLGNQFGLMEYTCAVLLALLIPVILFFIGAPPFTLISLGVGGVALRTISQVRKTTGADLNPLLGSTARLLLLHSILFSVGWLMTS